MGPTFWLLHFAVLVSRHQNELGHAVDPSRTLSHRATDWLRPDGRSGRRQGRRLISLPPTDEAQAHLSSPLLCVVLRAFTLPWARTRTSSAHTILCSLNGPITLLLEHATDDVGAVALAVGDPRAQRIDCLLLGARSCRMPTVPLCRPPRRITRPLPGNHPRSGSRHKALV